MRIVIATVSWFDLLWCNSERSDLCSECLFEMCQNVLRRRYTKKMEKIRGETFTQSGDVCYSAPWIRREDDGATVIIFCFSQIFIAVLGVSFILSPKIFSFDWNTDDVDVREYGLLIYRRSASAFSSSFWCLYSFQISRFTFTAVEFRVYYNDRHLGICLPGVWLFSEKFT